MTTPEPTSLPPRQSTPSRPPNRRGIALALAMVAALGLAAWLLFLRPDGAADPPKPAPTPSPTTAPSPSPPVDPQMGDDPVAAFRAIYAKRTLAISERRPEVVDDIYHADCACYELKAIVQRAIAIGEHHREYNPSIARVIVLKEGVLPSANTVNLRVITEQGTYTIVGDDGARIDTLEGWAAQSTFWRLIRYSSGVWKVLDMTVEGPAEEVLGPGWREASR